MRYSYENPHHAGADPFGRPLPGDWSYDAWPAGAPYDWSPATRGDKSFDAEDFHLDLGCGRIKKGRIGLDRYDDPATDVVFDLDRLSFPPPPKYDGHGQGYPLGYLPIPSNTIESIITHHALEHIGEGFIRLMDECYRVLVPDGRFRIIVPLFPSHSAVADPDHKRYFMEGVFGSFCGTPGDTAQNCWLASFSVPYTNSRFEMVDEDITPPVPPELAWSREDCREMRVLLRANK